MRWRPSIIIGADMRRGDRFLPAVAVREATGAPDDIIQLVLRETNFDVNEATSRLIDREWAGDELCAPA